MILNSYTKNLMTRGAALITLAVMILSIFTPLKFALAKQDYIPLTTIPGATRGCVPGTDSSGVISTAECTPADPVKVIKNIYGVAIGIAAVLAVIMIIWAGIEYATVESISGHSDAKERWTGAIYGLLLLLASYIILRTINIDLVNVNLDLGSPLACTPDTTDAKGNKITGNCAGSNVLGVINDRAIAAAQAVQAAEIHIANIQSTITATQTKLNQLNVKLTSLDRNSSDAANLIQQIQNEEAALKEQQALLTKEKITSASAQITNRTSTAISAFTAALSRGGTESSLSNIEKLSATARTQLQNDITKLKEAGATSDVIQKAQNDISFIGVFIEKTNQAVRLLDSAPVYSENGPKTLSVTATNERKEIIDSLMATALSAGKLNLPQAAIYTANVKAMSDSFDRALAAKLGCGTAGIVTNSSRQITCAK